VLSTKRTLAISSLIKVTEARENKTPPLLKYVDDFADNGLGPHNVDQNRERPITFQTNTVKRRVGIACQIDCMSVLTINEKVKSPLFASCDYRYYSYGAFADIKCIDLATATSTDIKRGIELCVSYAGCDGYAKAALPYLSSLPTELFRAAEGANTMKDGTGSVSSKQAAVQE
jgi:hypothetical protein